MMDQVGNNGSGLRPTIIKAYFSVFFFSLILGVKGAILEFKKGKLALRSDLQHIE